MTWNEEATTNDQKQKFLEAVRNREEESFASICRAFGISRETGYQFVRRHDEVGEAAFEPRSRRPLHSPQAIKQPIERAILETRFEHPTWGPRKIRAHLRRKFPGKIWPVASSIGDLLRRSGLTHARPSRGHVPPFTQPLAHSQGPNDLWCTDFKGWFHVGDGTRCTPLTLTDAATRMLLRSNHVDKVDLAHAQPIFEAAFREFGLPLAMRSDNGPPFATQGVAGLSRLAIWWLHLGIWPERIKPASPQQNGRHERMHRTMQAEVAAHPAPNLRLQQRDLDAFRHEFNTIRPHEALGQCPPADVYRPSPRLFPNRLPPIDYPAEALVRAVRSNGEIKYQGRTHFLGEALVGENVALWEVDGGWDVYFSVVRIARFDARKEVLIRAPRA